jgi:hypothetical protein
MAAKYPTLDRLKSQLLNSGIQQKNSALYQVIDQLIDALRQTVEATIVSTGGGSGGGGVLTQPFITWTNATGVLPNSKQLVAGPGIQFNTAGNRLIVSSSGQEFPSDWYKDDSGAERFIPVVGARGIPGPPGPGGIPLIDIPDETEMLMFPPMKRGFWEQFTTSWASLNNPQPALGNGTLTGRVMRIGRSTWYNVTLTIGTTTTLGTGYWIFGTPGNPIDLHTTAICLTGNAAGGFAPGYTIPLTNTTSAIGTITSTVLAPFGAWQAAYPWNPPPVGAFYTLCGFYEELS